MTLLDNLLLYIATVAMKQLNYMEYVYSLYQLKTVYVQCMQLPL